MRCNDQDFDCRIRDLDREVTQVWIWLGLLAFGVVLLIGILAEWWG